jgi:ribosomal protein S18 acetylase RimI-like enzyme
VSDAEVKYRTATLADCEEVARVHVLAWQGSFRGIVPQAFLDRMSAVQRAEAFSVGFTAPFYRIYVAEAVGSGIVGFADFGEPRGEIEGYDGELYSIYILPEFQRRGIGRKLVELGVEFLLTNGRQSMYLLTLEASPYRKFYDKLGGQVVRQKQIHIDGLAYTELIYGWPEIASLLFK